MQLFAPAIRIDEFRDYVLAPINQGLCPMPTLYLLNEEQERSKDRTLRGWLQEETDGLPRVVVSPVTGAPGSSTQSKTHGGIDNDPRSMNSVLYRILGRKPAREFTERDLQYE